MSFSADPVGVAPPRSRTLIRSASPTFNCDDFATPSQLRVFALVTLRRCDASAPVAPSRFDQSELDPDATSDYNVIMKVNLVRIGNSRGIRIPKPVIEQCGFGDEVEMVVRNSELVIRSSSSARKGWSAAFAQMAEYGDDELLDLVAETPTEWDEEEWEW